MAHRREGCRRAVTRDSVKPLKFAALLCFVAGVACVQCSSKKETKPLGPHEHRLPDGTIITVSKTSELCEYGSDAWLCEPLPYEIVQAYYSVSSTNRVTEHC